ncbi:MAG TPA: M48 family metalloprotease, partial [Prosthecobacter sp.]
MDPRWLFLIGGFAGITLLMILASHLALSPWRRNLGQHWTERARLLWPARQVQLAGWVGLLPTAGLLWGVCFPDDNGLWWVLGLILALLLGSYPAVREIEPRYTWGVWVRQMAWTLLVQGGALGLFLWLLFTMPEEMQAADGWRAAGGIAVIAVIVSGIWMPPVMRLFSDAHPQKERLARVVAEASVTSGVTPRYVWLATTPHANAFALVYIRGIVVTTRLMEVVSDEELKAVILHEMAHLREGWAVR